MSVQTGVTMKTLVNGYDLSGYFKKMDLANQRSMYDTTAFGSTSKTAIPGLRSGTIDVGGMFEDIGTVNAPDNVFSAIESAAVVPLVSIAPAGLSLGSRVYLLQAHENKHDIGAQVDALIMNNASFTDNDGWDFGVSLHALTAETGTANGTAVDNAASSANGGVAFLHVTAIAGAAPSVVVTLEHSTDNSTWVTLVTFAASTAISAQRVAIADGTTVRRYMRAVTTFGGTTTSITFQSSFARR